MFVSLCLCKIVYSLVHLLEKCNPLWTEPAQPKWGQSAREHNKASVSMFRKKRIQCFMYKLHPWAEAILLILHRVLLHSKETEQVYSVTIPFTLIPIKCPIAVSPLWHSALHWNRPLSSGVRSRISVTTCRFLMLPAETVSFTVVKYLLGSVSWSWFLSKWHQTTCTTPHSLKL